MPVASDHHKGKGQYLYKEGEGVGHMARRTNGEINGEANGGANGEKDDETGTKGTYEHSIQ
jgi:hypothetical protein